MLKVINTSFNITSLNFFVQFEDHIHDDYVGQAIDTAKIMAEDDKDASQLIQEWARQSNKDMIQIKFRFPNTAEIMEESICKS